MSTVDTGHSFDVAYRDTEDMYGMPYRELQDYFRSQPTRGSVLDLGCGQGRDALFLASIGYEVTAVDSSEIGVSQMLKKAEAQNLRVEGIVADILDAKIDRQYDVVLFDMVLHSFEKPQQAALLGKYSGNLKQNGMMCIVFPDDIDTRHFMEVFDALPDTWELKSETVVKDVPQVGDEEIDFTFVMACVQRSD